MFEGTFGVSIEKIQDDLWIGRAEQDGIAVFAYLRKYVRNDGSESMFAPGIAGLELDAGTFESMIAKDALELDRMLAAGENTKQFPSGKSYVEKDSEFIHFRACSSNKNPRNTVVSWRMTEGPLAGLQGVITVTDGKRGRYVVASPRQGVIQLRAYFVRRLKVAPIVTTTDAKNKTVETADTNRAMYLPEVRDALDAYGLYNDMLLTSEIIQYANEILAQESAAAKEGALKAEASGAPF